MIFGRVVTEIGYRDGNAVNKLERCEESIPIGSKKELLDQLFIQLERLKTDNSVNFEVFANPHNHEPTRMVVTTLKHISLL